MTVQTCLKYAKLFEEEGNKVLSSEFLERAKSKVANVEKYKGLEVVGFELKKKEAPKPAVKKKVKKKSKEV